MKTIMFAQQSNWMYASVVILAGILLLYKIIRWQNAVRALTANRIMVPNASWPKQLIKASLVFTAVIFLFLALLRPQWDKKETTVDQESRDLFIALDISRSMLAQDCKPNRLACAKEKIKDLVKRCRCERVGLIVFSGSAVIQCPLTTDYAAFFMFLDQIDVEVISSGATALDQAVSTALKAFKGTNERKTKLLAVFTDGEDFSSNLTGIRQEAARQNMTIFTFGVGTPEGAPIPLFDVQRNKMGHQLDKRGAVVITRLNEGILQGLAYECGGLYIKMTPDETDIKELIKNIERFEKEKFADKKVSLFQEQYPYCVAISFACLVLEWLL